MGRDECENRTFLTVIRATFNAGSEPEISPIHRQCSAAQHTKNDLLWTSHGLSNYLSTGKNAELTTNERRIRARFG